MKFSHLALVLIFSFLFLQPVYAQTSAAKNPFASPNDNGKINVLTRPRFNADAKNDAAKNASGAFDLKAVNLFDIERRAFDLINKKRAESGLLPLAWNEDLTKIARRHSANMAAYDRFSHTGFDGKMVNERADDAGIKHWRLIGENIAYNRGYKDPTECAVEKWLLSPGHRDNILKADWKETGVGVAVTEKGVFYFTQVFLLKK